MSEKPILRNLAMRGLVAAEKGLDRLRYDILGKGDEVEARIDGYFGYRSRDRLVLRGRLLEAWKAQTQVSDATLARVRNMLRLYESDELPGVEVEIRIGQESHTVVTDNEGYFALLLEGRNVPLPEATEVETATVRAPNIEAAEVEVPILAPGTGTKLAVISDIDDTILETGATNFVKNWRRVLVETPEERLVVPGAPEFYRMLSGGRASPVFYVSSSPWNLYRYLQRFLGHNDMPTGPMFLRDYGIDDMKFIAAAHTEHKTDAVKHILGFYPDLKFLLIGDDGQKDVKVYAEAAKMFPERIAGVFIRDVHDDGRSAVHDPALRELERSGIKVYVGSGYADAHDLAKEVGF